MSRPSSSHLLRLALGVVLSVGALALVLAQVDPGRVVEALRSVDPAWVAVFAACRVGVVLLAAWRWQALLAGLSIPFRRVANGAALGHAGNNLLPARAGEWIRVAWLAQQSRRPAAAILVTVGVERALDVLALALLAALTGLGSLEALPGPEDPRWKVGLALLLAAGLAVALLRGRNRSGRLLVPFGARVEAILGSLREALRDRLAPRRVAAAALRTAVLWAAIGVMTAVGARTVGIHLGFYQTWFLVVVVALGGAVPSAPGNIGTFHLACAWALVWLGSPPGVAAAAAVVMHAVSYVVVTLWGLAVGGSWLLHPAAREGAPGA